MHHSAKCVLVDEDMCTSCVQLDVEPFRFRQKVDQFNKWVWGTEHLVQRMGFRKLQKRLCKKLERFEM